MATTARRLLQKILVKCWYLWIKRATRITRITTKEEGKRKRSEVHSREGNGVVVFLCYKEFIMFSCHARFTPLITSIFSSSYFIQILFYCTCMHYVLLDEMTGITSVS